MIRQANLITDIELSTEEKRNWWIGLERDLNSKASSIFRQYRWYYSKKNTTGRTSWSSGSSSKDQVYAIFSRRAHFSWTTTSKHSLNNWPICQTNSSLPKDLSLNYKTQVSDINF